MIFSIYLIKKFFNALLVSGGISYAIFFIFSLIGNLGEKFSFVSILYISALNSFQIFTFIPSQLYILSFCLIIMNLKSKNELIIIKEYIELKKLFLIIFPILILFVFVEIKKESFSTHIEKMKTDLLDSKNFEGAKIFILTDGNKSQYSIISEFNPKKETINQYLEFNVENQKIIRGEISKSLNVQNNNLYSNESIIYENNDFRYEYLNKKLFDNFINTWTKNTETIIKYDNKINSNYENIQSILFHCFFYLCISMIFLSKKLVKRNINIMKIFLSILLIFLYHLLIPKIMLNNSYYFFQAISLLVFILIFFKTKHYE